MAYSMILALLAQGVTLEAEPRQAAITCGAAVLDTAPADSVEGIVVSTWFSLTSAMASGPVDTLLDRSLDDLRLMGERIPRLGKNGQAYVALCRQRFPLAWKASGVTLPAGDFERRAMCLSVGIVMGTYVRRSDPARAERLDAQFGNMLKEEELEARGLTDEAGFKKAIGTSFAATLPLGNFEGVLKACEAAFPG